MTLTDVIIIFILTLIILSIIYFNFIKNKGCHCPQIRRLLRLKKHYKRIKYSD